MHRAGGLLTTRSEPSLFRNRNFVLLFSGKIISLLGDQIYLIALSWFVLSATHSPLAAGLLLMSGALPYVLIGPFTGVLADWFESSAAASWWQWMARAGRW